ncbi:polysaccharide deacetylase family protein [Mucilaginibacter lappiensis]|uniref:Peptidoglycan/xylan/chitin deacetylase (PgdA/CDA1 family) n=1 Tax=Mucilaginibacter lappiensis TaxID=354630 RepID=A0A1N7EVP8_9SPHI|nr:polysaccharide deacetylase family protein [Mucilaginibacter lappiensis]MBB6112024.1 peptidoglycan/xylan/chitin deacetylase (PgdA/CDA1 family) [Mucilaginibacter lappiensis]MBB6126459.1 peptidoglycan/xylan/chitin deacetylase (PgdA/CDA1 family) [Mucilaginibacter lappiensis]SIR92136.1 Peptidoglycan/xylan/chitin deacetylase, PgdA/CDA1 family [Mucilaginibacter lappiensis]
MKTVFFILFLIGNIAAQAQEQIKWPNHKKSTIILTYDDALPSQLKVAAPQLKMAKLTATFFLTSDIDSSSIPQWRNLSREGFELGNHTVLHPCAGTDDNPVPSDHYTAYQIIREIEIMDRFLYAVDGKTKRTFAYPCAETTVGGRDYVDSLRRYTLVKYARAGGDSSAFITDFRHLDPFRVPSYGLEGGETGAQLIAFVKKVQQRGGMGILMIHGVGGDYITISAKAHQELIRYLETQRKEIWITTFQQAMNYVNRHIPLKAQKL